MSARTYLIDRFRGDAATLRDRMASLAKGMSLPGPDLATSRRMAEACDIVVALLQGLPTNGDGDGESEAMLALIAPLEGHARGATAPAVRAVFAGAITRIREVHAADHGASDATDASDDS